MAINPLPLSAVPWYAAVEAILYARYQGHYNILRITFLYAPALLFFNLLLWLTWATIIHPYVFCPVRHFPAVKEYTWFTWEKKKDQSPSDNIKDWIRSTPDNDGLILLRSAFQINQLIITNPNVLAEVLVQHPYDFEKAKGVRECLRNVLGDGLVLVEGDVHRFQRKHLVPAFHYRNVKELYPMMWKKCYTMVEYVKSDVEEKIFSAGEKPSVLEPDRFGRVEVNNWMSRVTLDIIGVAALGRDFNTLRNNEDQLAKNYEELLSPNPWLLAQFVLSAFVGWGIVSRLPGQTARDFKRLSKSLKSISAQLVKDKREAVEKGGDNKDILSILIKSNDFSDVQLADQVMTFLAAGHETTSSQITWIMYVLSTRAELQEQLRAEIHEYFPGEDLKNFPEDKIADTLEKMPLLNAVIQETLRIYPTIPFTSRLANKDTTVNGKFIPEGTPFLISPWALNRSVHLWGEDAEEYKPERWITNGRPNTHGGAPSNYCLMTWLHGPRNCIGQNFARAELRCLLTALVTNFKWTLAMPVADVVPAGVISVKPKNGMYLNLTRISKDE